MRKGNILSDGGILPLCLTCLRHGHLRDGEHIFDEDSVDGGGRTPDPVTTVLTLSRAVLIPCTAPYYERCSNHYTHMVENWEWTEATYIMGNGTVTLRMNGEKVE